MTVFWKKEDLPVIPTHDGGATPWFDDPSIFVCFHCNEPLTYPFILWHGSTEICFHPPCLSDWLPGIMRDAWEASCKEESPFNKPSLGAKFRRMAEEGHCPICGDTDGIQGEKDS